MTTQRAVALLYGSALILSACAAPASPGATASSAPGSAAASSRPGSASPGTPTPAAASPTNSPATQIIAFKTGTATVSVTIGSAKGTMTAPLVEVIRPDQSAAGGYFLGYRVVMADAIRDYLELSLPGLTSGTFVNSGGKKYVNIGIGGIVWTTPSSKVDGWSTQGLDSCAVVINATPTGGISGTIDCTGDVHSGADKVPYHAQGTFTAEP